MFADFSINSTGDLIVEEKPQSIKKQKIKFNICNTKTQKITLGINNSNIIKRNGLKINFEINDYKQDYLISIVKEDSAISQLIELKLKTVLGELPERKNFGSLLSSYKHKNIDDKLLESLKSYLKLTLSEYLSDVDIKITPKISYINGYKQIIVIEIYNNNKLLSNYELER